MTFHLDYKSSHKLNRNTTYHIPKVELLAAQKKMRLRFNPHSKHWEVYSFILPNLNHFHWMFVTSEEVTMYRKELRVPVIGWEQSKLVA